jgi:hypothetical protein
MIRLRRVLVAVLGGCAACTPSYSIQVTVKDTSGSRLSGAMVILQMYDEGPVVETTGPNGRATVGGLQETFCALNILKAGYLEGHPHAGEDVSEVTEVLYRCDEHDPDGETRCVDVLPDPYDSSSVNLCAC